MIALPCFFLYHEPLLERLDFTMILATLCYINDGDKTLMLHRVRKENDVHQGKWNGLGGKFEVGESPEECVIREIKEESGLTITSPTLRGVLTFPDFSHGSDWYVFLFTANQFSGDLIESPEGNLAWIETNKLLDLNLWAGDRIFIPLLAGDKFISVKMQYSKGELLSHQMNLY
jgi:8-oxo-dGTP diphosphatase